jgi:hypothetical protein
MGVYSGQYVYFFGLWLMAIAIPLIAYRPAFTGWQGFNFMAWFNL